MGISELRYGEWDISDPLINDAITECRKECIDGLYAACTTKGFDNLADNFDWDIDHELYEKIVEESECTNAAAQLISDAALAGYTALINPDLEQTCFFLGAVVAESFVLKNPKLCPAEDEVNLSVDLAKKEVAKFRQDIGVTYTTDNSSLAPTVFNLIAISAMATSRGAQKVASSAPEPRIKGIAAAASVALAVGGVAATSMYSTEAIAGEKRDSSDVSNVSIEEELLEVAICLGSFGLLCSEDAF